MDTLGTEIATQMLAAMTAVAGNEPAPQQAPSVDNQKIYLRRNIDLISIADRKEIAELLIMQGKSASLNQCAEGVIINLDQLSDELIRMMYNLLVYKINRLE